MNNTNPDRIGTWRCQICGRARPPGKCIVVYRRLPTPTGGSYLSGRRICWEHRTPKNTNVCKPFQTAEQKKACEREARERRAAMEVVGA